MPQAIKLETQTAKGSIIRMPATIDFVDGRIEFIKSPFALKDEIKAMQGSKWHGYDDPPRKIWSVADCQRNRMQLDYLQGVDVYANFDRELVQHEYRQLTRNGKPTELMDHQRFLANGGLTYHYCVWAAEMRTGKTLSAQMVIESSGVDCVYWIGPKTSLPNIKREFKLWGLPSRIRVEYFTYEGFVRVVDEWSSEELPRFVVFDEASRLKNPTSQRSQAAQRFADMIRDRYGMEGYALLLSGTPAPKTPCDWWSPCEIAWPGFLKEGSTRAMEQRLAYLVEQTYDAGTFKKRAGWRDDANKCNVCGKYLEDGPHDEFDGDDYHRFVPSVNEVALLYERLKGLVTIKHRKDCMQMPEVQYRKILCRPTESMLQVASAITASAQNAITGMTLLRELSDGFQYRDVEDGETACTHCKDGKVDEWFETNNDDCTYSNIDMFDAELVAGLTKRTVDCPVCGGSKLVPKITRIAKEIPCPKDHALKVLLDENEEQSRIVIFAGFTGSIDRIVKLCLKEKWDVIRCDQGSFQVFTSKETGEEPLDFWANLENQRVAFVANPESGGMSLTLNEARTAVYWSNTWKPEFRVQSEARINPTGTDNHGIQIADLIHLPSDERILNVIRENRRIELMTMGEVMATAGDGEMEEV